MYTQGFCNFILFENFIRCFYVCKHYLEKYDAKFHSFDVIEQNLIKFFKKKNRIVLLIATLTFLLFYLVKNYYRTELKLAYFFEKSTRQSVPINRKVLLTSLNLTCIKCDINGIID